MSFWQKPCTYCGGEIETVGLDRVDNARGYERDNLAACCSMCNQIKGTSTVEDFLALCRRVAEKHPC